MREILKEMKKETGRFNDNGTPIKRMNYLVTCSHCDKEVWILKGNHSTWDRCFECRNITHGGRGTALYKVWEGMVQRCGNAKVPSYCRYGGKGVRVLFTSFDMFREWSESNGYLPNQGLSIDRIDSNGNYEPDNCRWISLSLNSSLANRKGVSQFCLETGALLSEYVSGKSASDALGIDASSILKVCRGTRNKAGGFYWQFTTEVT